MDVDCLSMEFVQIVSKKCGFFQIIYTTLQIKKVVLENWFSMTKIRKKTFKSRYDRLPTIKKYLNLN